MAVSPLFFPTAYCLKASISNVTDLDAVLGTGWSSKTSAQGDRVDVLTTNRQYAERAEPIRVTYRPIFGRPGVNNFALNMYTFQNPGVQQEEGQPAQPEVEAPQDEEDEEVEEGADGW